jgi:hypothetical protein
VIYRETNTLLEEIADASIDGTHKEHMELLATVPLLIIDDLGMRKLAPIAAEELLEIVMRRHERASTLLTSNRPVEDWGKLLGDSVGSHRHARPPTTPRSHPEMRTPKLENQVAGRTKYFSVENWERQEERKKRKEKREMTSKQPSSTAEIR